ncbi:F-box protein At3g07870-like [Papaver somniferum]|uniref:F-box protein At3g07870-like n=1 Tax=Papaver somniferum TaxID=3469 RepID=UPI000E6F67EB|nr:F-box protein At3g07870-like [Papaver somniferum]
MRMLLLKLNHTISDLIDHGSEVNPGLIILGNIGHQLYYVKYDERNNTTDDDHKGQCIPKTLGLGDHSLNRTQGMSKSSLVGSCNGLICLAELNIKRGLRDLIHICNPIIRECLYLPRCNENIEYYDVGSSILGGFGYIYQTNEYKVVRILYNDCSERGNLQVYTLGGGGGGPGGGSGWRNRGVIRRKLSAEHGVFANGSIHWLSFKGKDIMAFNLSDEKFHVLPMPPVLESNWKYNSVLESFGEWLCVNACGSTPSCLDIWTYKQTSSDKNIAALDNKDETWSWCKEFSITLESSSYIWHYRPFAVTRRGLVLLKYKHSNHPAHESYPYADTLFCYQPKTATMKRLGIWGFFKATPHTNSLVSLEASEETTCKNRKCDEGLASLIPSKS